MRIRRPRPGALQPDMTPMIDVVFQLLIFFIITAQLVQQAVPLLLPLERGARADASGSMGLVVNLTADGEIVVLERRVEAGRLPELARELLAREPRSVPVVRADRRAAAARLNDVMTGLREGGCRSIRISTEPGGGR